MAANRKKTKKPKDLGLYLSVFHPTSMGFGDGKAAPEDYFQPRDDDGQYIDLTMVPMKGEELVTLFIRRGISADTAASILRKLAQRIEKNCSLLVRGRGFDGWFDENGTVVESSLSLEGDYDPSGNDLTIPDIE
jgi:hypothetical protein